MSQTQVDFSVGQKIRHPDFGEGVVTGLHSTDYVEVFFQSVGAKSVPRSALRVQQTVYQQAFEGIQSGTKQIKEFFLAADLTEMPLLDNAASLTSAKIDLLPHQIVLVHKIANASPRRFLIADEVGLGKTIETALLLRELASRGEMTRALMVVPAGLVDNWRRELNDIFNLDFEVFGSEGDVTDRRSNAFLKHNRLIASIDTLKRPKRLKNILEAPKWDLIVFDEAHHLTAVERGRNRVHKTENFELAESLKEHTRDLLLLSATPHQGDHFRFWRLIHLLDPTLFSSAEDMLTHRHRLNSVVIRRTKADACDPDGDTLFARRQVVTKAFALSASEKEFYQKLNEYLREGFALAKRAKGNAKAIGFVMSIFQKIAASSFAAVRKTLFNRSIALAILEAVLAEEERDMARHDKAVEEAGQLIRERDHLTNTSLNNALIDKYITDVRLKHLKRRAESLEGSLDDELTVSKFEEDVATLATVALPGERKMIENLLKHFPTTIESKVQELSRLLSSLWKENQNEKIVIFATYLGTVEMLKKAIETIFEGRRVEIYKGGDQGAKIAAEKRFRAKDGPQVMLCTAAGREGINLQYSRILVNFDLPWNPMDIEQRIGRIHRYGQENTSQIYNFVSVDTIEGSIYMTLQNKILEIAATLGKVDENGDVAEDLLAQILGQLSVQVSYDQLYREALEDPELKRTEIELSVALGNAKKAQEVVFELFQDLERFDVSEYRGLAKSSEELSKRLVSAFNNGLSLVNGTSTRIDDSRMQVTYPPLNITNSELTISRDLANSDPKLGLLGFDHPILVHMMQMLNERGWDSRAVAVRSPDDPFLLVTFRLHLIGDRNVVRRQFLRLALSKDGLRLPEKEHLNFLQNLPPVNIDEIDLDIWAPVVGEIPAALERDLKYRGVLAGGASFHADMIGMMLGI